MDISIRSQSNWTRGTWVHNHVNRKVFILQNNFIVCVCPFLAWIYLGYEIKYVELRAKHYCWLLLEWRYCQFLQYWDEYIGEIQMKAFLHDFVLLWRFIIKIPPSFKFFTICKTNIYWTLLNSLEPWSWWRMMRRWSLCSCTNDSGDICQQQCTLNCLSTSTYSCTQN